MCDSEHTLINLENIKFLVSYSLYYSTVLVRSGVVQGSVLGPLLFVLFVDDIVDRLGTTMGTKLYADDLKIYTRVRMDEPGSLAEGFIRLEEWSVKWQLGNNESKCSVMHLGNGASNTPYRINQIQLPSVDKICDLGVTHDNTELSTGHFSWTRPDPAKR